MKIDAIRQNFLLLLLHLSVKCGRIKKEPRRTCLAKPAQWSWFSKINFGNSLNDLQMQFPKADGDVAHCEERRMPIKSGEVVMKKQMQRIRILIGDDTAEFGVACANALRSEVMYVFTRKKDGDVVLHSIQTEKPNIVIMNMTMPHLDAIAVMEKAKQMRDLPIFIVVSSYENRDMEQVVLEHGASYFVLLPFDPATLHERIEKLMRERRQLMNIVKHENVEMRVTKILQKIGVSAHLHGYYHLRTGIILAVHDPSIMDNVMTRLYPDIATEHYTTASRVERSIRHAISVAWDQGNMEFIQTLFHYSRHTHRKKPTNSEFIALLADNVRLEQKPWGEPLFDET